MNMAVRKSDFQEQKAVHDRVAAELQQHFRKAGISVAVNVNTIITPERDAPSIDILIAAEDAIQMQARRRPAMKACQGDGAYNCNIRWEYEPVPV